MAGGNRFSILFVVLIATMMVASHAADCSNDVNALREKCLKYISAGGPKTAPDTNCCSAVHNANIPCVCTYLNPAVAKIISAEKLIYVAQYCGRPLKRGSKCGSVVVHG